LEINILETLNSFRASLSVAGRVEERAFATYITAAAAIRCSFAE
jgi:hypothetical protein